MNSDFALSTHKTVHVGAKRDFTTYSWDEWNRRYTPSYIRCLTYRKVNDKMVDIQEQEFTKGVKSIIPYIDRIIILEWRDSDLDGKANSFLNNCLPIDKSQRFHDGIVGLGLGRWLQALFMNIITKAEGERQAVVTWFSDVVRFVASVTRLRDADKFFGVVRTTLQTNDKVEDILVYRLLQTILKIKVPRQRMFRWFELSIQRVYKRNARLRDAMLTPMVWLYTDFLLDKDLEVEEAFRRAFEQLMILPSFEDSEIVRVLLQHIFPEIDDSKTGKIMQAITQKEPYSGETDTVFTDGSVIGRKILDMPYGIRAIAGTIGIVTGSEDTFEMRVSEYNNYTPFMIHVPEAGTEFQFTITAKIIKPDMTSRFGPGLLCRTFKDYAKTSKDFQRIMGLTLAGGRGNGCTAPTNDRRKPTYLSNPPTTESDIRIATVSVSNRVYSLHTTEWASPLTMEIPPGNKIFALFFKGMRDIQIKIQPRVSIEPAPPSTFPVAQARQPAQASTSFRFSDLVNHAKSVA